MKINKKIRLIREENDLTQEDMATKLGMSVNGYAKIERGQTKVNLPKLEQIAESLGVNWLELISQEDKNIFIISHNETSGVGNVIGSQPDKDVEIQKLQLVVNHQIDTIQHLEKQITHLEEIIALLKASQKQ
jgi:transcriptional regulator with XRE-family HTH domain